MSNPGQNQGANLPQSPLTQFELERNRQELGLLGHVFGSYRNAPYYTASIAIFVALGLLGYVLIKQPQNTAAITLLGAIVTGGLGFLFGRSSLSS